MFLVTLEGVKIKKVVGIFETDELAKEGAVKALDAESDDYHVCGIYKCTVNQAAEPEIVLWVSRHTDSKYFDMGPYWPHWSKPAVAEFQRGNKIIKYHLPEEAE